MEIRRRLFIIFLIDIHARKSSHFTVAKLNSCFDHKKEVILVLVNQTFMTNLERKITYFTAGQWSGHNLGR